MSNDLLSTLLLYGESGTGKTRECAAIATYIAQKYKLKTRYITADGGGYEPLKPLIEAGIVDVLDITGHPAFLPLFQSLSTGGWKNGTDKWNLDDSYDGVGCLIVETISNISSGIMEYLISNKIKAAQDLVAVVDLASPTELGGQKHHIAAPAMAHYGVVNREILVGIRKFIDLARSKNLKYLVFTSHISGGKQKIGAQERSILGPAAEGQKIVAQLPSMLGDMIFLTTVKGTTGPEFRAYFTPYPDPELGGKCWPARMRGSASFTESLLKSHSTGYIKLQNEADPLLRKGITSLFEQRLASQADAVGKLTALLN